MGSHISLNWVKRTLCFSYAILLLLLFSPIFLLETLSHLSLSPTKRNITHKRIQFCFCFFGEITKKAETELKQKQYRRKVLIIKNKMHLTS